MLREGDLWKGEVSSTKLTYNTHFTGVKTSILVTNCRNLYPFKRYEGRVKLPRNVQCIEEKEDRFLRTHIEYAVQF